MSSELLERLRDYGLTLEPNVVICDRRVVDEAAAHIGALEAENARLLGALIEIECRPEKMIWGGSTEVLGAMRDMEDIARRAREGGNADG